MTIPTLQRSGLIYFRSLFKLSTQCVRALVALLLVASCSACMRSLVWSDAKLGTGALNVDSIRPLIQARCGADLNASGRSCSYAFVDSQGKYIDVFHLVGLLDRRARKVPQLQPWIAKADQRADVVTPPYQLHLLTVSPAIVLAVPSAAGGKPNPCNTLLFKGCAQSQTFRGSGYWFRTDPRVAAGSFWYTLEDALVRDLDEVLPSQQIEFEGALLRLAAKDGVWQVLRLK
jgi:hypothetical protein